MVIIVGAGITGLALAHHLAAAGVQHLVLEAADRPGGAIRTLRRDGRVLELGPQRVRLTPEIRNLVQDLGLTGELLTAEPLPLYVYHGGRLRHVPRSMQELLRTDLLSWHGKLRLLGEPFAGPLREEPSVAAELRRRIGDEAYLRLAGPLFGGLYGTDPADMRTGDTLLPLLREAGIGDRGLLRAFLRLARRGAAPAGSFHTGLQALPEALARAHTETVRFRTPVRGVRPAQRAGWSVDADHERYDASDVVLTTPAAETARILRRAAPDAAARLDRLRYNPILLAFLDAEPPLPALGFQVALTERLEMRGATFNAALFPDGHGRDRVCTAFLGGARGAELGRMPDAWIGEVACNEFSTATGHDARLIAVERASIPAWDRSWSALHALELPRGLHLAANYESRVGIGGRLARARRLAAALAAR